MSIPMPVKLHFRRWLFAPVEWLRPQSPPRWLRVVGDGDFAAIGQQFLQYFRDLAQLRPQECVLDIGCGVGRLARPLRDYLAPPGGYLGFDVLRPVVNWCQQHLAARYPHFRFEHLDIRNAAYNPGGRLEAAAAVFPVATASIDFAFATSVFTHLLPDAVHRYLLELARVLRPGGRALLTCFLLNESGRELMRRPESLFHFRHRGPGYFTTHPRCPEIAVAYERDELLHLIQATGLETREVFPGTWSGRAGLAGQDMVLVSRPPG